MGNNNTSQEQQQDQQQNNNNYIAADLLALSPITIDTIATTPLERKYKKLKHNTSITSSSSLSHQIINYRKTWEIVNLCTYNEWLLLTSTEIKNFKNDCFFYEYKNVNKIFSCKGKCRETCTNGFCLYTASNRTQKKLLSNRKYQYCSNNYQLGFRFKKFFILNKKKYSTTHGHNTTREAKKIMDHFKYNHLPAMFSSFHHYNVKGLIKGNFNDYTNEIMHQNSLLLINIYSEITEKTRFVLINLKTNKFLTIFGDYHGYINANDVYAQWSPDLTKLLLRINSYSSLNNDGDDNDNILGNFNHQNPTGTSFIDYYDISKRDGKLLKRLKYFHKTTIFAFDPTFKHSKLVITDYYRESSNSIYIVDLNSKNINNENDNKLKKLISCSQNIVNDVSRNALDIKFSLDGSYIILTVGDSICCCRALPHAYSECKYLIFDAYTCQLIKYYTSFITACTIHMCPLNYLPKVSTCQTRMAIPKKYIPSTNTARNLNISSNEIEEYEDYDYYESAIKRNLALNSTILSSSTTTSSTKLLCSFPILKFSNNDNLNSSNSSTSNNLDLIFIKIIQMPSNLSLKNLCRIIINRNIKNLNSIQELRLPESLKSYLLYRPQMV